MHAINGACLADITGVVFHSKYMQDFIARVMIESQRKVHFGNALEYKIYNKACLIDKNIKLYNSNSVQIKNTRQLVRQGIMKSSLGFNNFLAKKDLEYNNLFRIYIYD